MKNVYGGNNFPRNNSPNVHQLQINVACFEYYTRMTNAKKMEQKHPKLKILLFVRCLIYDD